MEPTHTGKRSRSLCTWAVSKAADPKRCCLEHKYLHRLLGHTAKQYHGGPFERLDQPLYLGQCPCPIASSDKSLLGSDLPCRACTQLGLPLCLFLKSVCILALTKLQQCTSWQTHTLAGWTHEACSRARVRVFGPEQVFSVTVQNDSKDWLRYWGIKAQRQHRSLVLGSDFDWCAHAAIGF